MMSRFIPSALRAAPFATPGPSSVPARCLRGTWCVIPSSAIRHRPQHNLRYASTATSKQATPSPTLPHPSAAFEVLNDALTATQPCFGARGDEVTLLTSPQEFYDKLLEMIQRARRRIIISSLYIGAEEGQLVSDFTICRAMLTSRSMPSRPSCRLILNCGSQSF